MDKSSTLLKYRSMVRIHHGTPNKYGAIVELVEDTGLSSQRVGVQVPVASPYAVVAQLVAHHLAKVDVAGSSPVYRSRSLLLIGLGSWPLKPKMLSSSLAGITSARNSME